MHLPSRFPGSLNINKITEITDSRNITEIPVQSVHVLTKLAGVAIRPSLCLSLLSPKANTADINVATTETATDTTLLWPAPWPGPWPAPWPDPGPEVISVASGRCRRRRPRCTLMLSVTIRYRASTVSSIAWINTIVTYFTELLVCCTSRVHCLIRLNPDQSRLASSLSWVTHLWNCQQGSPIPELSIIDRFPTQLWKPALLRSHFRLRRRHVLRIPLTMPAPTGNLAHNLDTCQRRIITTDLRSARWRCLMLLPRGAGIVLRGTRTHSPAARSPVQLVPSCGVHHLQTKDEPAPEMASPRADRPVPARQWPWQLTGLEAATGRLHWTTGAACSRGCGAYWWMKEALLGRYEYVLFNYWNVHSPSNRFTQQHFNNCTMLCLCVLIQAFICTYLAVVFPLPFGTFFTHLWIRYALAESRLHHHCAAHIRMQLSAYPSRWDRARVPS